VRQAQGRCGFDGIAGSRTSRGRWQRGLAEEHGAAALGTASWAQGGHHCCGLENVDVALETAPVWSTASSARVGEDGGA
jgi:hypothetical protein